MPAETHELIQQSLQGDQRAFGLIVERYQGAVSAMAYSVTGNLAQSEDLAQEAFIIAWKKLGALQKHESLSAWLCGIARNLARDWMRTQAARPTVSMEHLDQAVQPLGEAYDATQRQRERADLVWTALAEIPETYREPLILFYRQGESIRDIAEALELTEDNVKQRLSRGRKLLRAEVARTVEDTLADTRPGKAFTLGVIAALPALYGAKAGAAKMASTSATAAAAPAAMGALIKIALPVAVAAVAVTLGGLGWRLGLSPWNTPDAPISTARGAVGLGEPSAIQGEKTAVLKTAVPDANVVGPDSTVSGVVIFRDNGEPAPNTRVVLLRENEPQQETVTDAEGIFTLVGATEGEVTLVAYDARHEGIPVGSCQSDEFPLVLAPGKRVDGLQIKVPALCGEISGTIADTKTGAPLADIRVSAYGAEGTMFEDVSNTDGRYRILGPRNGTWTVGTSWRNSIFSSTSSDERESVLVASGEIANLDLQIDRGIPLHGNVIDTDGNPVAKTHIKAILSPAGGGLRQCEFESNEAGSFTVWGAQPGDRIVLMAQKDGIDSPFAVIIPEFGVTPSTIMLSMLPMTSVSGRFVDEEGRPTKAVLMSNALGPNGPIYRSQKTNEMNTTFAAEFAQGGYELEGHISGVEIGRSYPQTVRLGTEPVNNLVIKVAATGPSTGEHTVTGRVVDEQGNPLHNCYVGASGGSRETVSVVQSMHTGDDGEFQLSGLRDGTYRLCVSAGNPYAEIIEPFNPVETPELTVVARRAPVLRGRVVDGQTGEAIKQFHVACGDFDTMGREEDWGPSSPNFHANDGYFEVPGRPDTEWTLLVSASGYAPQRLTGGPLLPGEEAPIHEFKLDAGRVIQGTVVDSSGKPIPHAMVFADKRFFNSGQLTVNSDVEVTPRTFPQMGGEYIYGACRDRQHAIAQTDVQGRFTADSIPDDAMHLYVWLPEYTVAAAQIAEDMRVVLLEGGAIEGRVTVNGAEPQGEVLLTAWAPSTHDTVFQRASHDGTYRVTNLMSIPYRLQVTFRAEGATSKYFFPEESVTPTDGTTASFDIDIPLGNASIDGMVLDNGVPAKAVEIQCTSGNTSSYVSSSESGAFRFEDLSPGTVVLSVTVPSDTTTTSYQAVAQIDIAADEVIQHDIELPR